MLFIDIIDWLWPSWWWAIPLICVPFLLLWYLAHFLEESILLKLVYAKIQNKYNISLQYKEPRYTGWCLQHYRNHPSLYTSIVNSTRLLSYGLLIILAMTTIEPILMGMVTCTLLFPFHFYGTIKYSTIEGRANNRYIGMIEGGFLDEMRMSMIQSSNEPKVTLEQILEEISETEDESREAIRSLLWTMKLMKQSDDINRLVDDKIRELRLENPP